MPTDLTSAHVPITNEFVLETVFNHSRHGRANEYGAPIESDCLCRGTTSEGVCAEAGCGYCRAAQMVVSAMQGDGGALGVLTRAMVTTLTLPELVAPPAPEAPPVTQHAVVFVEETTAVPVQRCMKCGCLTSLPFTHAVGPCIEGEHDWKDSPNGESAADLEVVKKLISQPASLEPVVAPAPKTESALLTEADLREIAESLGWPSIEWVKRALAGERTTGYGQSIDPDAAVAASDKATEILLLRATESESSVGTTLPKGAYHEAASRGTHSASTQDGIAAETEPREPKVWMPDEIEDWLDEKVRAGDVVTFCHGPLHNIFAFRVIDKAVRKIVLSHDEWKALVEPLIPAFVERAAKRDGIATETASAHFDVSKARAELLEEIDVALQGSVYWQGGRLDTIKHLKALAERSERAEAALAGLRAATQRLVDVNDEMGQAMYLGGPEDDPKAWGELVTEVNAALDECRKLLPKAAAEAAQAPTDQGPALEGSPAAPASSTEGERRQDAGAVGTAETAGFSPLRQPEPTGPAPAPD
ncbi:MAG: hypothetical protein AAB426_06685, partial [Myxococcota bacterium]